MKIIKFVSTRCQILRLKCTKFDFGLGSAQAPLVELTALPQTSWLDLRGPTSRRGEKGKGEEGGEGRAGREREGTPKGWFTPPMFEILKNTLNRSIGQCCVILV